MESALSVSAGVRAVIEINEKWPITRAELPGAYATSRLEKIGSGLHLGLMLLIGAGKLSRVFWADSPSLGFDFLFWLDGDQGAVRSERGSSMKSSK